MLYWNIQPNGYYQMIFLFNLSYHNRSLFLFLLSIHYHYIDLSLSYFLYLSLVLHFSRFLFLRQLYLLLLLFLLPFHFFPFLSQWHCFSLPRLFISRYFFLTLYLFLFLSSTLANPLYFLDIRDPQGVSQYTIRISAVTWYNTNIAWQWSLMMWRPWCHAWWLG